MKTDPRCRTAPPPAGRRRGRVWLGTLLAVLGIASVLVVAADARSRTLIENTLLLAAAGSAVSLPVGTVLAWLVLRTDLPGRKTFLAVFVAMLFVPLYLQAAAWQAGFGLQGWQTLIFRAPPLLEGWAGAVWVHAVAALPWVVLIVGAGFSLIEPELEQQALLNASARRVFARVSLPAAAGAITVAAVWIWIVAAGDMTVTDLFVVRTYAEEVYTRVAVGRQPGEAPLAILPGAVLCAWLVLAGLVLAARLAPGDRPPSLRRGHVFSLGPWRVPLAILLVTLLLFIVGVPLGNLCYKAGVLVTQTDAGRLRSWSAGKCLAVVLCAPIRYQREFGWSLGIGVLAATASVAAAIPLAWIARAGRLRAAAVLVVTAALLALPGPVVGLAVIHLLNRPEIPLLVRLYDQSILAPWLALSVRGAGPAVLILWHAFRFVPRDVLDAAAVDGAGPVARLVRIVLPASRPALGVAWLVALAVALGDLAASILVVPPGVQTLSIRIFELLHYGVEDQVAGIALALVALFVALAAAVTRLTGYSVGSAALSDALGAAGASELD